MSTSLNDGSDDSQTATLAVSGLVFGLAIVTVALRFYTRKFTEAGLKYDNWFILASVILTLVTAVLLLWGMFLYSWSIVY